MDNTPIQQEVSYFARTVFKIEASEELLNRYEQGVKLLHMESLKPVNITKLITQELDASDQVAFIEKGVPAVQFFSGPNEDYHKPTDKIEKIDADGLVKVITVARETLVYLADRDDAMNFTGEMPSAKNEIKNDNNKPKEGRKVSTGTMPDFAYSGEGVKVAAVSENSPGAKAGLLIGDIIKKVNGKDCKNLKEYSDQLKEHQPGDEVTLTIERNGKTEELKLILAER